VFRRQTKKEEIYHVQVEEVPIQSIEPNEVLSFFSMGKQQPENHVADCSNCFSVSLLVPSVMQFVSLPHPIHLTTSTRKTMN